MLLAVFQISYWHVFTFSSGYSFQVVQLLEKYFTIFIKDSSSWNEGFNCREISHKCIVSLKATKELRTESVITFNLTCVMNSSGTPEIRNSTKIKAQVWNTVARRDFIYKMGTLLNLIHFFLAEIPLLCEYTINIAKTCKELVGVWVFFLFQFLRKFRAKHWIVNNWNWLCPET